MKNNTLTASEYASSGLFWTIIAFVWYYCFLFVNMGGTSAMQSRLILVGMIILLGVFNLISTMRWSRNGFSVFAEILTPFGIYSLISYRAYLKKEVTVITICAILLCAVVLIYRMTQMIICWDKLMELKTRMMLCYKSMQYVGTAMSIAILSCVLGKTLFGGGLVVAEAAAEVAEIEYAYTDDDRLDNNLETISLLSPSKWRELTDAQDRLNVLQCLVNCEGRYMGLDRRIRICAADLDEHTLGNYNHKEGIVLINADYLMSNSPYKIVMSVCHEMHHAGTRHYVDIYSRLPEEDKECLFL